ncbi:MAG: hypothetical protein WAK16_00395 [Candidatus Cybelea sp.]
MYYPDLAQLLIDLDGQNPPVWRRILVSAFTKLGGLHRIVQASMGWDPNLPHRFVLCGDIYKRVAPGEALDPKRERNWRLDSACYPDDFFFYECGSNYEWRHRVLRENYVDGEQHWRYPRCVGGGGVCPPGTGKPFTVGAANRRIWSASPKH